MKAKRPHVHGSLIPICSSAEIVLGRWLTLVGEGLREQLATAFDPEPASRGGDRSDPTRDFRGIFQSRPFRKNRVPPEVSCVDLGGRQPQQGSDPQPDSDTAEPPTGENFQYGYHAAVPRWHRSLTPEIRFWFPKLHGAKGACVNSSYRWRKRSVPSCHAQ
jgi:hypothetical protein